eukprot:3122429-Pyramimonas_sp.AAC.1
MSLSVLIMRTTSNLIPNASSRSVRATVACFARSSTTSCAPHPWGRHVGGGECSQVLLRVAFMMRYVA